MSFRRPDGPLPDGPPPELTTTRVSSGVSARLVAVAVAGLLVAVVGFTVVNRPPPPAQQLPTSPAVAAGPTAAPSAAPSATPFHIQLDGNDGVLGGLGIRGVHVWRPTPADVRDYGFTAQIAMTGGNLAAALKMDSAELYRAYVTIPSVGLGRALPIEVGRTWSQGGGVIYEAFGSWSMRLKALRRSRAGLVPLLVRYVPPDATPGAPVSGYTFTVMGARDGANFDLILELVWPATR